MILWLLTIDALIKHITKRGAMKRRDFMKLSCGVAAGFALSGCGLGVNTLPVEDFANDLGKNEKLRNAVQTTSICCYCAVGCGLICSTDENSGKVINIEGDPEHPINEGSLCAKGAAIYQTTAANDQRLTKVLYRAPYTDAWVEKDWDFAIDRIARKIKEERDASFVTKNKKGQTVNRVESIAHLGSSNIDSEECWSTAVFARSIGLVYIDHQARV